jgi:hypothetical protein
MGINQGDAIGMAYNSPALAHREQVLVEVPVNRSSRATRPLATVAAFPARAGFQVSVRRRPSYSRGDVAQQRHVLRLLPRSRLEPIVENLEPQPGEVGNENEVPLRGRAQVVRL